MPCTVARYEKMEESQSEVLLEGMEDDGRKFVTEDSSDIGAQMVINNILILTHSCLIAPLCRPAIPTRALHLPDRSTEGQVVHEDVLSFPILCLKGLQG